MFFLSYFVFTFNSVLLVVFRECKYNNTHVFGNNVSCANPISYSHQIRDIDNLYRVSNFRVYKQNTMLMVSNDATTNSHRLHPVAKRFIEMYHLILRQTICCLHINYINRYNILRNCLIQHN